jgi:O-antigen ligase
MAELTTTVATVSRRNRARWLTIADYLVVAAAVSLPWSTSATSILLVVWLLAVLPALDFAVLRQTLSSPAGALPVLLGLFGIIGTLWAETSVAERLAGVAAYQKFLVLPLLLTQFRQSQNGGWVIKGFLASATALLAVSWVHGLTNGRAWLPTMAPQDGVPVKDYITQSQVFQICIFGLAYWAVGVYRAQRWIAVLAVVLLIAAFFANVVLLATSRTTLFIMPVLLLLLGFKTTGLKGVGVCLLAGMIVAGIAWESSPYLRDRVNGVAAEISRYRMDHAETSSGIRLELWRKSLGFIAEAPVLGHGTGSIYAAFHHAASGASQGASFVSSNPHQQTLAIGIELGLTGVMLLFAFWAAHAALFSGPGLVAWCGLTIVVQNILASQFNSHLFDFTQGWLYVVGVGVLGGTLAGQTRSQVCSRRGGKASAPSVPADNDEGGGGH